MKEQTSTTTTETLLPCPFCASADLDLSDGYDEDANWVVVCRNCKASGTFCVEKARAIERWNTRAPAPQPVLDTGEWYVASESSSPEGDAAIRARGVAAPHDWIGQVKRKHAAQIVADHRLAAAVPKLVDALTALCEATESRDAVSIWTAMVDARAALAANQKGGG